MTVMNGPCGLILQAAARARGPLVALVCVAGAGALAELAAPALVAGAVDAMVRHHATGVLIAELAGVFLIAAGSEAVVTLIYAVAQARGTVWLRERAIGHALAVGVRSRIPTGDAVTRVVQAGAEIADAPAALADSTVSLLTSLGGVAMLWWLDWRIGLAFCVIAPAIILTTRTLFGGITAAHARYMAAQAGIAGRLVAALSGLRTIRASGTTDREIARVLDVLPDLSTAGHAMWAAQRRSVWKITALSSLTLLLVLAVAGWVLADGGIAAGQFLAVIGYVTLADTGLNEIDTIIGVGDATVAAKRLRVLLGEQVPAGGEATLPTGPGALSFTGVTVLRDDTAVIDDVNLEIPAGRAVALVGASGAGKSTLAALVGRLTDPDRGTVTLDGIDIATVPVDTLRRHIAYAFDTPALLGRTVREAIGYGPAVLSTDRMVAAAATAGADAFITRLPDGYDTTLADAPMSGGELQRVGLARAIAVRAAVYVLDDATSGLDAVTEAEVRHALTDALAGRTRLVVTHRATTAADCDLVAWLDAGRVRACARHDELWQDPAYRAIFDGADLTREPA